MRLERRESNWPNPQPNDFVGEHENLVEAQYQDPPVVPLANGPRQDYA